MEYWQEHWHEHPEDVTPQQIVDFVTQARMAKTDGRFEIKRVKLVGGEPLMAKHFREIFDLLVAAAEEGVIGKLKISTNGVAEIPEWARGHPKVTWTRSPPKKKKHTPMTWSPKDMGYEAKGPCSMPFRCGASLDATGWLPCSAAMMIVKAFDMEYLYKKELPDSFWGHELCTHCVHAMPDEWMHDYFKTHKGLEKVEPTESWRKALAHYEEKAGIQKKVFSLPMA